MSFKVYFLFLLPCIDYSISLRLPNLSKNINTLPRNIFHNTDYLPTPSRLEPGPIIIPLAIIVMFPPYCIAQDGAFELDAKYYIQNLLGNKVTVVDPRRQAIYPSPRYLNATFANKIIQIVQNEVHEISNTSNSDLLNFIDNSLPTVLSNFSKFVPIVKKDFTDQYYFDIYLYMSYLYAKNTISESKDRVQLRTKIGQKLLYNLPIDRFKVVNLDVLKSSISLLPKLHEDIRDILDIYSSSGLISSYILDDENLLDEEYIKTSFNEDLGISLQITLIRPATMLGVLEMAGSNTFFHPEIFANTISARIHQLGFAVRYEDYFFDNYYREDAGRPQAQDILIEIEIKKTLFK